MADHQPAHPATTPILRSFEYDHLPPDLREVSRRCRDLAEGIAALFPAGGPELTAGLRHLLEAKDAFVRAAIHARGGGG